MDSITEPELLFPLVLLETFNLVRKAAILAAEDKPIDSNIETDYEKPRKRQLPARFTQNSDDDEWELKNIHTKRKRQVAGGSHREMERTESERENQAVSQVNSVPAPAVKIREQLAALKARFFNPIKASNTKKKVGFRFRCDNGEQVESESENWRSVEGGREE